MHQAGVEIIGPISADTTHRTRAAGNVNVEKTLKYFVVCEELNKKMQQVRSS